ncbi:hypothetical protein T11_4442 [Trichinella zimbabwensis]|uniref:Uncharacterized protein n=1 Tax=Trichinella zimbabwensis TaxID=268475 RepID=A0A0V1GE97_9BILA|nr:hypothetical protein T11_4442 [Trichinella zimbabwensis]
MDQLRIQYSQSLFHLNLCKYVKYYRRFFYIWSNPNSTNSGSDANNDFFL